MKLLINVIVVIEGLIILSLLLWKRHTMRNAEGLAMIKLFFYLYFSQQIFIYTFVRGSTDA